jgi:hypothetical protein
MAHFKIRGRLTAGLLSVFLVGLSPQVHAEGVVSELANDIAEATDGRVNLSGYINGHVMKHDDAPELVGKDINGPIVQLREASLFADIVITDNLLFSTELEMSYDFSNKKYSGREDRAEAIFNYYYLNFDVSSQFDWDTDETGNLGLRFGRILVPFLNYNENKPSFKQSLMSQPFTAWQIVPVNNAANSFQQYGWTDTGLMVNWNYATEESGVFDGKFSVINGMGNKSDALDSNTVQLDTGTMMNPTVRPRDGLFNARSDWDDNSDVNDNKAVVIKLSYAPYTMPLNVGVSWYKGAWDEDDDKDLTMYGMHIDYSADDWGFKGEYVRADVEQTAGINVVTAMGPAMLNKTTGDYRMEAWYIEGEYKVLRYGDNQSNYLMPIVRFDRVITNDQVAFSPFNRRRVTVGLEWQFMENVRLRAELQKIKLLDFDKAPAPFVAAGGHEDITMKMLSLIAYF